MYSQLFQHKLLIAVLLTLGLFTLLSFSQPKLVFATPTESTPSCTLSEATKTDPKTPNASDLKESKCKQATEVNDCNADSVDGLNSGNCGIIKYLNMFIDILSGLVVVIIIGVIIVGGIQYSASGGDAQAVAAAKKRISNALLALVVYSFTYAFLQWIIPGGLL